MGHETCRLGKGLEWEHENLSLDYGQHVPVGMVPRNCDDPCEVGLSFVGVGGSGVGVGAAAEGGGQMATQPTR